MVLSGICGGAGFDFVTLFMIDFRYHFQFLICSNFS